jgi:hypothetical protein
MPRQARQAHHTQNARQGAAHPGARHPPEALAMTAPGDRPLAIARQL